MRKPVIGMVLNTMGFGGVTEAVFQLARALPASEFDLKLCVMKKDADENALRLARFEELGMPVHFATEGAGKFDIVAAVAEWIASSRIDLLHTHSYRPNLYARLAGVLRRPHGLGIVAHYHNQYDDKWSREPSQLALERQMAASTDAMVAVSQSVRGHIAERLGIEATHIDVVPNGVEAEWFNSGDRSSARDHFGLARDDLAFGIIGRICEQKGQDLFTAAAISLADEVPNARFLIIGDGEDKKLHRQLHETIAERGLGDVVRFTGHQSDMARVYAALDVVVAPSRWEGFGLMLVEAMAASKPIIAADVGAIPEVVGSGGAAILVPPNDSAALAQAMKTLALDPTLRAKMSLACSLRQRSFSWQASANALALIYWRVLSKGRGA